jgi:hypothetical protein
MISIGEPHEVGIDRDDLVPAAVAHKPSQHRRRVGRGDAVHQDAGQ